MTPTLRLCCLLLLALFSSVAMAAMPAGQRVEFPSLDRDSDGKPITITALYFRPPGVAADAKVPVLVALHGCDGYRSTQAGHEQEMRVGMQMRVQSWLADGIAVLMPDSFNPRGRREVCTVKIGSPTVLPSTRRMDAIGALNYLAAQPGVDRDRIGLIGWSHGGSTVLATINAKDAQVAQFRAAPGAPPFFHAAVAFYPGCGPVLRAGDRWQPAVPTRVHIGDADDWTLATPCVQLGDAMKTRGEDFTVTVYPEAHHAFDSPVGKVILLANVPNGVHPGSGVHVGPNPEARTAANASVHQFMRQQLQN